MPAPTNGTPRDTPTRLALLEWRAAVSDQDIAGLRSDMNDGFAKLDTKMQTQNDRASRQLWATWTLVATILAVIIPTILALR